MDMEMETVWLCSPTPSVVTISDSEEMEEVYVEEIVLEEDGSPAEQKWNADDVLTLSSNGFVTSLGDASPGDLTDSIAADSPRYILPDSLTQEEDILLEESFSLMEDLISKNSKDFEWKDSGDKNVIEKAQELLDHLDEQNWLIKQEPFPEWLEEKTELPLLEELNGYVGGYEYRQTAVPATVAAVPYHPRSVQLQIPNVGQIAPQMTLPVGLSLLTSTPQIDLTNISAQVPTVSVEVPPSSSPSTIVQQPPLTPALIREFESVLHQTLTPPHTPPTYIDLVNNQDGKRNLAEEELDALINSQVASLYEDKREKDWPIAAPQNSPPSDWSSASPPTVTEDSDSASHSSSESDPDWAPSPTTSHNNTSRNRRAVSSVEERKLRKKEQNKNAATRYRQKKKAEQADILGEENVLLEKNISLKEKATELQREIKYLKSLMRDVCKAKGLIK